MRQVTPLLWELESSSKIHDTNNGDVWERLAAGDQSLREAAEYRHDETPRIVPVSISALEWLGETPKEAGLGLEAQGAELDDR